MVQPWFPFYIGTRMLGDCVISLVLNRHSKDLKQRISVTARLQLSVIQQGKDKTPYPGKPAPKERPQSVLAPSFYMFVSFLPWSRCKLVWPRRGCLCFTWGYHSSPWIFFCSIFMSFSFLHLLPTAIFDSLLLF